MAAFEIGAKVKLIAGKASEVLKAGVVYTVNDVRFLKDKNIHVHGLSTKDGEVLKGRWSDKFLKVIVVEDPFKGNE
mgnify:FL=1